MQTRQIFDTKTASVHVNEINDVAYTPFAIQMLEKLAQYSKEIQSHIASKITEIKNQTPLTIKNPKIEEDTEVSKTLIKLSTKSKPENIHWLAQLEPDDELRQSDLPDDPGKLAAKLEALKGRITNIRTKGKNICNATLHETIEILKTAYSDFKSKEDAVKVAANKLFTGSPLPEVGSKT